MLGDPFLHRVRNLSVANVIRVSNVEYDQK